MSRILIVEEQPVTRHALRLMMEADRHEVVGEADNGPDALLQVRQCKPDLMILELSIPRLGGLEVLQRLVAQDSPVKVLVLTSQDSEYFAGRCLTAGAAGFVSKQEDPQAVREAVRAIAQGHSYFPSHALGSVSAAEEAGHGDLLKGLSVRELSVLQLLARGLSNIAIADQLSISDKTVSTYKVRLMQKLHAKSLVELIDIGRRHGLVEGGAAAAEAGAEAQMSEEQQRELGLLRNMIDALPHPMTVRALDSQILYCNQATQRLLGLPMESILGKRVGELEIFEDSHEAQLMRQRMVEAIAAGEPYDADVEFDSVKGHKVFYHWGRPYHDANGKLLGAICGSIDVTGRDDVLRELRSANSRMASIASGKARFIASMGSELQGPLRNVLAMVELALNQDDPSRRTEPLIVARSLADNLLQVLDDLQTLSRAELGRLRLQTEAVDLRVLLERQLQTLREAAQAKGLTLQVDFDLALKTRVWCDPQRVRQVLDNLLGNAIKNTEQGSVLLRLHARGKSKGLVEVQIDVIDTGVGISLEEQEDIFLPFHTPLASEDIGRGSTGLGLALSRSLIELMGGDLTLTSAPGSGSQFSIFLTLPGAGD